MTMCNLGSTQLVHVHMYTAHIHVHVYEYVHCTCVLMFSCIHVCSVWMRNHCPVNQLDSQLLTGPLVDQSAAIGHEFF